METNKDERLERAVAIITELIELVGGRGLAQSELFLSMAKLQLQLDLNGITDEEFGAFCDAIDDGTLPATAERARAGQRPRRDSDMRGMGRAWQCPQGVVLPRRGGRRIKQ
jgi:hypothetical protein